MAGAGPLAVSIIGGWAAAELGVSAAWGYAAGAVIGGLLFPQRVDVGTRRVERVTVTSPNKGAPLPIAYGRTRIAGNVIWTGNFRQIARPTGKGGKGGKGVQPGTAMKYSVSAAIALCEGVCGHPPPARPDCILRAWASGEELSLEDLLAMDMVYYSGTADQAADTHIQGLIESDDPDIASRYEGQRVLRYPHACYIVLRNYDLGSTATLPNFHFEVLRYTLADDPGNPVLHDATRPAEADPLFDPGVPYNADYDMNPVLMAVDILTHPRYGMGRPAERMHWASIVAAAQWCRDAGIFTSQVIDHSRSLQAWIEEILAPTGVTLTFSQGQFRMQVPRYAVPPDTTADWAVAIGQVFWRWGARGDSQPVVRDPNNANRLCMVGIRLVAGNYRIAYWTSNDAGATWAYGGMVDNGANFTGHDQIWPSLSVRMNMVCLVFTASDATWANRQVWYSDWNWLGAWTPSVRVSNYVFGARDTGNFPQNDGRIQTDLLGRLHLVWTGQCIDGAGYRELVYYRRATFPIAPAVWGAAELITDTGLSLVSMRSYHAAVTVATDNEPRVSWCEARHVSFGGAENDDWWWGNVVDEAAWPDRDIAPLIDDPLPILPTTRVMYCSRAGGAWGTRETVTSDYSYYQAYPIYP
ncbi:hypothetical protein AMK68_03310, partial [candidate division KD3-62 bacterium DG_56]